jgi:hypothetical protein
MADTPIDQVIDEVLGGDFGEEQRAQVADEVAYQYFSKVREQAGGQLDEETARQINSLVPLPQEERGKHRMRVGCSAEQAAAAEGGAVAAAAAAAAADGHVTEASSLHAHVCCINWM